MQGTALLLLTITISISILLNCSFILEKNLIQTLDVHQKSKKRYKRVEVVGTVTSTLT